MEYFVYILYSESSDRYYIGSCSDLEKRLSRHNAGATPSTKPYRPWSIVYTEKYTNKPPYIIPTHSIGYGVIANAAKQFITNARGGRMFIENNVAQKTFRTEPFLFF